MLNYQIHMNPRFIKWIKWLNVIHDDIQALLRNRMNTAEFCSIDQMRVNLRTFYCGAVARAADLDREYFDRKSSIFMSSYFCGIVLVTPS